MLNANDYRSVLVAALAAVLVPLLPASVNSATTLEERRLSFYHTHTQETLNVAYAINGEYVDSALAQINEFLSDFRTGDVEVVDPELLDLIHDVRESLNSSGTFEIISAYRSPKTNEMLRVQSQSSGVARNSQHVLGKAIDVRLRGIETSRLRDTAIALQRGGVGYYAQSNFVHLDTGRVRRW